MTKIIFIIPIFVSVAALTGCQLPEAIGGKASTPTIPPPRTSEYVPNSIDPNNPPNATGQTQSGTGHYSPIHTSATGTGANDNANAAVADNSVPDSAHELIPSAGNPQYAAPYRSPGSPVGKPRQEVIGDQVSIPVTAYRTDSGSKRSSDFDQQNADSSHDSSSGTVYVAPELF